MSHIHAEHYHAEISFPACMPEWENAYITAEEAVGALQDAFSDEDYTLRVYNKPLLIVLKSDSKPSTLNCFVYECDAVYHIQDYQLMCEREGGDVHGQESAAQMR